jgi:hypothetical protein
LNNLSFDRIGSINGCWNFGTLTILLLDLLSDMRKGIWKEANTSTTVSIYRRNLQRAYIERMEYLMKEEIKNSFRLLQCSAIWCKSFVRGELP